MADYQYKARDKFGKLVSGVMTGQDQQAVSLRLRQLGYVPVSVREGSRAPQISDIFGRFQRVSFSELNIFTRQFFTLQKAGLPISLSLNALQEQAVNRALKEVIVQLGRDIEAGASLSAAMSRHPRVFNELYVSMIKSAEASGRLDEILQRLAALGEHEEQVRLRVKSALRYPAMVVGAIFIGFIVLAAFVAPRFLKLYSQFKVRLPFPTRVLLGTSSFLVEFWWLAIIFVALAIWLFRRFIKTSGGRLWWDGLKLKIPVLGPLIQKMIMSRFSRLTAMLLKSGIPLLKILELASSGAGNLVVCRAIENIKTSVNQGKGMLEPMKVSGLFPPIVIQMVSVGEETGKLDELLMHISGYYDSQIDYTVNNLVSLIEPLLILFLGISVLFMALGIFLPMWNLMSLFRR